MSAPEPMMMSFAAQHPTELYSIIGILVATIGALFMVVHNSVNGNIAKLEAENGALWRELRKTQFEFAELKGAHDTMLASGVHKR